MRKYRRFPLLSLLPFSTSYLSKSTGKSNEEGRKSRMASVEGTKMPARRSKQGSIMVTSSFNPFLTTENVVQIKTENLVDANPITSDQLKDLKTTLLATEDNEERLHILEEHKVPYLFCSENMIELMEITPSVKTKISIVNLIGPRLTDPRNKMEQIVVSLRGGVMAVNR